MVGRRRIVSCTYHARRTCPFNLWLQSNRFISYDLYWLLGAAEQYSHDLYWLSEAADVSADSIFKITLLLSLIHI